MKLENVLAALPGSSQDPHAAEVAIARLRDATGSRELIRERRRNFQTRRGIYATHHRLP